MATARRAARVARNVPATAGGTRAAILEFVRHAQEPVGVARICEEFGLNHTGVRRHLANLRDAGLVTQRVTPPAGRGRPTLEFEATAAAEDPAARQRELVKLLLEMVTTSQDARAVGRRAGERLAADLQARHSAPRRAPRGSGRRSESQGVGSAAEVRPTMEETLEAVEEAARHMGFDPARQVGPEGEEEILLRHCPFADGATLAPEVVCALHLGMAEGVAQAMGSSARLSFAFMDPRRAGCRLVVR